MVNKIPYALLLPFWTIHSINSSYLSTFGPQLLFMKAPSGLLYLNMSMLFMSTSGVLGRYITMDSAWTTWWRCVFAAVFIFIFCRWQGVNIRLNNNRSWKTLILSAFLLSAHWMTYFYALDLSNVAIALLSLYSFPAITALIEPLITRVPFRIFNLGLAVLVMIGIAIMLPSLSITDTYTQAIGLGLLSALLYSVRNIVIKGPSIRHHGGVLMFHQMWMMVIIISPLLLFIDMGDLLPQLTGLLLLGLVTTALGHTLFLYSLKYMPVIKASLIACIVPVYGVLWGVLFLDEIPTLKTIAGGAIILFTVILTTLDKAKSFD